MGNKETHEKRDKQRPRFAAIFCQVCWFLLLLVACFARIGNSSDSCELVWRAVRIGVSITNDSRESLRANRPCHSLSFLSLFFWKKAGKTTKKTGIFYPDRTPKIPGKEGKNDQKNKEFLARRKNQEFQQKTRKGRTGLIFAASRVFLEISAVGWQETALNNISQKKKTPQSQPHEAGHTKAGPSDFRNQRFERRYRGNAEDAEGPT